MRGEILSRARCRATDRGRPTTNRKTGREEVSSSARKIRGVTRPVIIVRQPELCAVGYIDSTG